MKTVLRLGALATLFALLLILGSSGGLRPPGELEAAAGNNLTIRVTDPDSTSDHQFAITRPNPPCAAANTSLSNNELALYNCPAPGDWTVTVTPAVDSFLTGATCTFSEIDVPTAGQQSAVTSFGNNVLALSILDDEDADCTFTFAGEPESTVSQVLLEAAPLILPCGGTTTLTATAFDQNDQIIDDGLLIFAFTTDSGNFDYGDVEDDGIVTLTLKPGDPDATVTVTVDGVSSTITIENDCIPLSIFASPPYLPCGGGTTNLTAVLRDGDGNVVPDVVFQWSTTSGSALDVGPPNSPAVVDGKAVLFLPSSIQSATVTVVAGGESESVEIIQVCGPLAISLVADPNVIPCGGTANLTASARDINGRNIPNLGYHWSTEIGVLYVGPPNTADETDPHATLTLVPGMESALVKVWVGPIGPDTPAPPAQVTVQQFCPEVVTDGSGATGSIQLSASSLTAGCGEAIFIGARVRDAKNQVPAEGTDVRFIASAGVFQVDAGVTTTYGGEAASQNLTTVSQYNAATNKNGVLNITYLAPLYGGDVAITAASGDKFTRLTIKVNCAAPPPAAVAATGGTGGASTACTPIGDGVCIRPPTTGASIRPPSTGDAGLK